MSQTLDPASLPLHGSRLIEASAGTGKTWTIAALYLRLVLGHGAPGTAFGRPLLPAEILVMTFTRAATRELSDRIRARLVEAARCFRGEGSPGKADALITGLMADYPDEAGRQQAAWRLAMASEAMDDAAIFTIDAWCQRMLREHAFDSGVPFDEELMADEQAMRIDAARDYWRQHCYPLPPDALETVLSIWEDPEDLTRDVRELLGQAIDPAAGDGSLADCMARAQAELGQRLAGLSEGWIKRAADIRAWLEGELAHNARHWNGQRLRRNDLERWLGDLESWARNPENRPPLSTGSARHRLSPAGLLEARKDSAPAIDVPAVFDELAALHDSIAALPRPSDTIRLHAAATVARRLATLKREARSFGFADMLERLDRALGGAQGERLRARIRAQYPVALIDEFQDTSPLQYRIFDALYGTDDNDPATALLLIGDPKQSIYGFRGADIYSYLQARRATDGRHYVLGTNFRSAQPLVEAINALFGQAESRPGGAFLFGSPDGNPLPFEPVKAHGRDETFCTDDGPVAALTIAHDLELRSTGESRALFAARCAERIVGWLNDRSTGFRDASGRLRQLRAADIAVLVRTGVEAEAVRRELRRRGVPSVFLSDKDSVFASVEAGDLLRWLRAVASPFDARLVRTAVATRTIGLPIEELARLAIDDDLFDVRSAQMRALHDTWRSQGVLAMLRRTLHLLELPARWLNEAEGERRLTNFLHLAELLQDASAGIDGEQALVRWLAMQIEGAANADDERVLRLESDSELVQVVTVHKSKGLEYPVVCLPFACSFRSVERRNTGALSLPDAQGRRSLRLSYSDAELALADAERLREDLRLFYVAATRARHTMWMGFAALKSGPGSRCLTHRSAAGCLVGGQQERAARDWQPLLDALTRHANADRQTRILLAPMGDQIDCTPLERRESLPELAEARVSTASFERRWALGSFSSLVRDIGAQSASPVAIRRPAEDELEADGLVDPATDERRVATHLHDEASAWHRFPRGAFAGDFLHGLLEWLAGEGFALDQDPAVEAGLRRRCERAGHGPWADVLVDWMRAVISTPLPAIGAPLRALKRPLAEMEFWLPAQRLLASEVDASCRRHLLDGEPRPQLPQRELQGMLMGFADLVLEHDGRYWVLDYKSNWLGANAAAYPSTALRAAMARHRYDVQAALYLLALHRLLRARLGDDYDPARQLGGALYYFIRGVDGPTRGEYLIAADSGTLLLLDEMDHQLEPDEGRLAAEEAGQ